MDAPTAAGAELARSLKFIRRINGLLGYRRQVVGYLDRFSRDWPRGRPISILDVATGSADVPRAIARWAAARGHDLRLIGLDRHVVTAAIAQVIARSITKRQAAEPANRLSIVRGDALRLPFADGAVDYAITSTFLHHLDDDQCVAAMRELVRVARRGIIVADLLRTRRAYFWISLFTLAAGPMVRHDARLSVAQALNLREARDLARRAGLAGATVRRHFGHRFVIAADWATRPSPSPSTRVEESPG
jgi:SAM-dependent methyltransferase